MDPVENPYRPGAGTRPLTLAGRADELRKAEVLFRRILQGAPQRSLMFYGLRGVGKTVLLNEVDDIAVKLGFEIEVVEISENDDFRKTVARVLRKILLRMSAWEDVKARAKQALGVLKAFTIAIPEGPELKIDVDAIAGAADSGNFQEDLTGLIVELGEVAKAAKKGVCLLFDEAQYLQQSDFSALIAASHRIAQKSLPIAFVCAGLPQIAEIAGEAKSYAERLFDFVPVGKLIRANATEAIIGPARERSVLFEPEAVELVIEFTEGYPYFIQECGKHVWDIAAASPITREDAARALEGTERSLDESFFKVRIDRATAAERKMMRAMAALGSGPYKTADVAKSMNRKMESLGPTRASLIGKGFIYSPDHGYMAFTVPQFDRFLSRYSDEGGRKS